ncbi:type II secretion system protein [Gluconobacter sp. Dm-62]|uniref:prepilin-type N-terminal cleavage/methylation domain-containing protein n=1 Tax=Gluconobacter sp. Dm-62 TaxID=2799804 RepID=UPI001B8C928A|nr:type II secretion system protein [Gluconobacter sp. Dm-62]MBS1103324.1 type II secretion system protein [Gluconobacter sp. Dm-62]
MVRERGFTLLETIIAIAIASAALAVLMLSLGSALDGSARLSHRQEALEVAHSQLDTAMAVSHPMQGTHEGEMRDGLRWQIETHQIALIPVNGRLTGFFSISSDVFWGLGGHVRLTGRRFAPAAPS